MTRKEFKTQSAKVATLAQIAVSFTPTQRDDDFVDLISHLFTEQEHLDKICDMLGIPPDSPPA